MHLRSLFLASMLGVLAFWPAPARAETPSSPEATKMVGIGFAGTGVALAGAGGYFLYKGNADHDPTTTKLGVALFAGGAITTAIGLVVYFNGPEPEPKAPAPRHALVVGPQGARYFAQF